MRKAIVVSILVSLLVGLPLLGTAGTSSANVAASTPPTPRSLSVPARGTPDTLILVAGRARRNDPLQTNIQYVTDTAYGLFRGYGYSDANIAYLATDPAVPGFDAQPTAATLRDLITEWAAERTGIDAYLTLLLVNHGDEGVLYLDRPNGEQLSPGDLAQWLDLLAAERPDIRVNVIIEAACAGSFIAPPSPLSRPGRVIITSTSATHLAWASPQGAVFSDAFLGALGPNTDLNTAFTAAQWIVAGTGRLQYPWVEADGDAIANEIADLTLAGRVKLFGESAPPAPPADEYEPDDDCASASSIPTNGLVQDHIFQDQADVDWVTFKPVTDTIYIVEVQAPPGSAADVVLERYATCPGAALEEQDYSFTTGARLEFQASQDAPVYLRLRHHDPAIFGPQAAYHLAVRGVKMWLEPGALIVVAADMGSAHPLQPNIDRIGRQVYGLFNGRDYPDERITYLANAPLVDGIDGLPTKPLLQQALLDWAPPLVDADHPLTLYLIGKCEPDLLYLDRSAGETVQPQELAAWLRQLEAERPGLKTNIVLEGCYAGSFVGLPHTLSAAGRVVIGATGGAAQAWATGGGAFFSDYFLAALDQESSLLGAFRAAQWAAGIAYGGQTPWLDGDGDGIPNEPEDATVAAQRGLPLSMALCSQDNATSYLPASRRGAEGAAPDARPAGLNCAPSWSPSLAQATIRAALSGKLLTIRAEARDDLAVERVWARVYPPSYRPPAGCTGLAQDPAPVVLLARQEDGWYSGVYDTQGELGGYRAVIYAEDNEGLRSQPLAGEITIGSSIYLPLIHR